LPVPPGLCRKKIFFSVVLVIAERILFYTFFRTQLLAKESKS